MQNNDDEPSFYPQITDLRGEQPRTFTTRSRRPRWRWGLVVFLLLAVLAGGELVRVARPLVLTRQTGHVTPTLSRTAIPLVSPTLVAPAVFTTLAARPLHFPTVTSLATCPVSLGRQISPNFGLAAGTGPLYIVPVDRGGNAGYGPASTWGDHIGWGGMPQTLWIFPTSFSGPVLVRGQRLDKAGVVGFDQYAGPPLLTQLPITAPLAPSSPPYQVDGDWYIRFNAPGCYGLQIDWLHGTESIIFRATAEQG